MLHLLLAKSRLPRSKYTSCVAVLHCRAAQGLQELSLEDWCFAVAEVMLTPWNLSIHEQPPALRAALTHLRAMEAPGAVLTFHEDWAWSQALAGVLAEALPYLTHLNVAVTEVNHNAGGHSRVYGGSHARG